MIKVHLSWIADSVQGQLIGNDISIESVCTDTRSITPGCLFVALVGPNFDAHDFVGQARESGACALLVSKRVDCDLPTIVVEDTHFALGALGAAVKAKVAPKTIGITGSSGKTTVREMVASILLQRGKVLANRGNLNNQIGVPLTLLELREDHEFAVIEMGTSSPGEIDYTSSLVKPDVSTILNASAAHLQGLGSTFGVAKAKSEIFNYLPDQGLAVLNKDSEFYPYWLENLKQRAVTTFSMEPDADYYPDDVIVGEDGCAQFTLHTPQGTADITLPLPGMHNVSNALVASALAQSVGATLSDVSSGLADLPQVKGRLNVKLLPGQIRLLDDTYNANVSSVKAAIDVLSRFAGRKIIILGDIGELGEDAALHHQAVGEYALQHSIDNFYSLGNLSRIASDVFKVKGSHFSDVDTLVSALCRELVKETNDITILIKGSRSARMERVVSAIEVSPLATLKRATENTAC